jgi:hypothetical protein
MNWFSLTCIKLNIHNSQFTNESTSKCYNESIFGIFTVSKNETSKDKDKGGTWKISKLD